MTISYNWLCDYLPERPEPEKLAKILNSIGLEVESFEKYQEVKGGLEDLIIGEVLEVQKHPNADKLSLTKVNIGNAKPLDIVCGAPNVAAGQKVIVAPVGTTIYPTNAEPMTMKLAKIRGAESQGMICAEDEVGLGAGHDGIFVLSADAIPGTPVKNYFNPYEDYVFEIGLTPNRSDAMSHLGVARDVCAYLSHHEKKSLEVVSPLNDDFKVDDRSLPIVVVVENTVDCPRYSGVSISGVTIGESPAWLKQKLKAIGQRPINNIVDITNFVLHETGQPLHAFDADQISGKKIIVKNLPTGTSFMSLDEKERKLDAGDLMICNGNEEGMCIGGVFGGIKSGVKPGTKNIFLESAWFNPVSIRKTSFRHNLRTDAATHFEKGVDISNTVKVLKRAALLIKEIAGGKIASDIVDMYPSPKLNKQVFLNWHYLKKLSGKIYTPETTKEILERLGFGILREDEEGIQVEVPLYKTDISLPADIVEEIMRIDGFDQIVIPTSITISPSVETLDRIQSYKTKIAGVLVGQGFHEIMCNSISNSNFYSADELSTTVKMLNNLSAELNVMRPSMLETGLESIAHNLNRKNNSLRFFEFGKTYRTIDKGKYSEASHLALFVTGNKQEENWKKEKGEADLFFVKGITNAILLQAGLDKPLFVQAARPKLKFCLEVTVGGQVVGELGMVDRKILDRFDIRQDVWFADFYWEEMIKLSGEKSLSYAEISKFPSVQRDLALVVDKQVRYEVVEKTARAAAVSKLSAINLFDIFSSEKLGSNKKSMAISLTFQDDEKTLTDKEIDSMMQKIIATFEKELQAEIRK